MAADPRSTLRAAPHPHGTSPATLGRDHRRPDGEDQEKRGSPEYEGAKNLTDRKRHLLVDPTGLLRRVLVHPAALSAVARTYRGQRLRTWLAEEWGGLLAIAQRPRRWGRDAVEVEPPTNASRSRAAEKGGMARTIAWIGRYRRLRKDDADLAESRDAMIEAAVSQLLLYRLARQAPFGVPSPQRQGLSGLARVF